MKPAAFVLSLLCLPLQAQEYCPEADRQGFLARHAPAVRTCKQAIDNMCLDTPRLVDDALFQAVIDPHPAFFPKVRDEQVWRWPRLATVSHDVMSRVPPATFVIVDDALRLDLTRRTVFVTCDGAEVYLRDSGGLNNGWNWYGPIALAALTDRKVRSTDK